MFLFYHFQGVLQEVKHYPEKRYCPWILDDASTVAQDLPYSGLVLITPEEIETLKSAGFTFRYID